MTTLNTRGDALTIWYTGASVANCAQRVPGASLGGLRSGTEYASMQYKRYQAIAGLMIDFVAAANGEGTGAIIAIDASTIQWVPPGGIAGPSVTISDGETKVIEGGDPNQYIRARRTSASALGGSESVALFPVLGNLWDRVSSAEAVTGDDEYRALILKNSSQANIDNVVLYLRPLGAQRVQDVQQLPALPGSGTIETAGSLSDWPAASMVWVREPGKNEHVYYSARTDALFAVAANHRDLYGAASAAGAATATLDPVPPIRIGSEPVVSDAIQSVADEGTAPTAPAVTWMTGIDAVDGLIIGTLTPGQCVGLWVHRLAPVAQMADPFVDLRIDYSYDDQTPTSFAGHFRAVWRVANDALRQYEIFDGVTEPDFDNPVAQSATLPLVYAPAWNTTHNLVYGFRNAYGLRSLNQVNKTTGRWQTLILDDQGAVQQLPPSAPTSVAAASATGGVFNITAEYNPTADLDTDARADTFVVFANFDGIDPDPDVDAPIGTQSMVGSRSVQHLDFFTAGHVDGSPINVIVRTRISASGTDSTNTAATTATLNAVGPVRVAGEIFHEDIAAEYQESFGVAPTTPADDYVIDATNNIRIELTDGSAAFYGDTFLIWRAMMRSCDAAERRIYFPSDWVFKLSGTIPPGGTAAPIEVGSWTSGDKRLYVNVNGVRRCELDVSNKIVRFAELSATPVATLSPQIPVHSRVLETVFSAFDAVSEQFETYAEVTSTGRFRFGIDFSLALTQPQIEAL